MPSSSTGRLRFDVIGSVTVSLDGNPVASLGRKSLALLGHLLLSGTPTLPRNKLTALLWSEKDEQRAKGSLRQTLSEIQRAFRASGGGPVVVDNLTASLSVARVDCDAIEILQAAERGEVDRRLLARDRLTDDILGDVEDVDPNFSSWLGPARESFRGRLIDALVRQLPPEDATTITPLAEAAAKAIRRLDLDDERSVRVLIKAYAAAGNMGAALALYARLWLHLEDTYDVEPHTLTQELIARIRREQPQTLALPMDPTPQAASRAQPMLGPFAGGKPSIAVLPFRAGSLDVEHYLTSGIADSVVHALSALNELFVISRGSTLVYVDPSPDFYAIGRELGVRYIVHGSVQKAGQRLRVSTELVDTERSEVIYPNLRDGTISDFFDLQDQIAIDMVKFIAPEVRDRELRRSLRKRPQDITAYDLVLQSYEPLNSLEYAEFSRARDLLQRAMTLDPTYASAYAYAAWWHSYRIGQEWSPSFVEDSAIAERLSRKAIEINPKDALSLAIFGHQESYLRRDYASALRYFDQSLGLCPNLAIAWTLKGATLCFSGNFEEAVDCAKAGVRLAPMDQSVFFAEHILAQAKHLCGHYEDALYWSEKSNARNKQLTSNLRLIIANMSALGRSQDAAEVAARHRDLAPNFTVGAWHSRTPLPGEAKVQWAKWLRSAGLAD